MSQIIDQGPESRIRTNRGIPDRAIRALHVFLDLSIGGAQTILASH